MIEGFKGEVTKLREFCIVDSQNLGISAFSTEFVTFQSNSFIHPRMLRLLMHTSDLERIYSSGAQCCSCLFVSGGTVVYRSHYKWPQLPPKVDFGGPNYRLQASLVASHVDWPSRTLSTVRPARQDVA